VRKALRWGRRTINPATRQKYIAEDISRDIEAPMKKSGGRDRVLNDHEIRSFWQGCHAIGWPFGPLLKLMLLLGQRGHKEIGGMVWTEIDRVGRIWHLPGSRTKNGLPNDLHLSDLGMKVIDSIPRQPPLPERPDFMFSTTRCGPSSGFVYAKVRLVKFVGSDDWTFHDLRRTMATGMAKLGVRLEVTEAVLNHTSGKRGGLVAVYQRYDYAAEKREALDQWAAYIETLIKPPRLRRPGSDEDLPLTAE
jgi:integrase